MLTSFNFLPLLFVIEHTNIIALYSCCSALGVAFSRYTSISPPFIIVFSISFVIVFFSSPIYIFALTFNFLSFSFAFIAKVFLTILPTSIFPMSNSILVFSCSSNEAEPLSSLFISTSFPSSSRYLTYFPPSGTSIVAFTFSAFTVPVFFISIVYITTVSSFTSLCW